MNNIKFLKIITIFSLLLMSGLFAGSAAADPANAILDITLDNATPTVGQQIIMTYTLTAYDHPAEEFNDWRIEFEYNTSVLELVPGSCTANPSVWATGSGLGVGCAKPTVNTVRVGEGNFTGASSSSVPMLLGTATFNVIGAGSSDFVILTNLGDTEFGYTPTGYPTWTAGTINMPQATATALTVTWNGSTDNDWANSANWTPAQVPDMGIIAVIPAGPTTWPQIDGAAQALDLTIAAGAELMIVDGGSLSVEGAVVNNGRFIQTIATVPSGGSRFLHIQDQTDTVDKYQGVDITPNTGMTEVTVSIRGNQECTITVGETVQRCFDIGVTGSSDTATVTFHYLESERGILSAISMKAYHWSGAKPWQSAGTLSVVDGNGPDYSVTMNGVNDYSPFVIAPSEPLSVTLQSATTTAAPTSGWLMQLLGVLLLGVVTAVFYQRHMTANKNKGL